MNILVFIVVFVIPILYIFKYCKERALLTQFDTDMELKSSKFNANREKINNTKKILNMYIVINLLFIFFYGILDFQLHIGKAPHISYISFTFFETLTWVVGINTVISIIYYFFYKY